MRDYEKTHPWIKFEFNSTDFSPQLWMALGEAQSKCEHIAGIPLKPEVSHQLHTLYLAKGAHATTAIEGNTLSEKEVLDQIEGKLVLPTSKQYLGQAIDNIVEACNYIKDRIMGGEINDISIEDIKEYNKMILKDLPLEEGVIPGIIRLHPVGINGMKYRGAPASDCEHLLKKMCEWLNKEFRSPTDDMSIAYGLLKAIVAHVYFVWIHPFGDGNGRTARLIEIQILLSHNVPTPAVHLLSDFYNETRDEYYKQLNYTSLSGGNLVRFVEYAIRGFVDELKKQVEIIRKQQWDVAWKEYIYDVFEDKTRPSDKRRRNLLLDISKQSKPIPISEVREISPRLAKEYALKTPMTAINDIANLLGMGLIERTQAGIIANKNLVLSFLPERKKDKIKP